MGMSLSRLQGFVMDREAWRAAIHGVAKSQTRLSDWTELNWSESESVIHMYTYPLFLKILFPHTLCVCVCSLSLSRIWLCNPINCSLLVSSVQWDYPCKNAEMGYYFLLQGIFLTQGSNLHLLWFLHWQADSLPLSHLGSSPYRSFVFKHYQRELQIEKHTKHLL